MTALFHLGSENSFHQFRSNTYISISEIRKFFFIFLDAIAEMRDEYVYLPRDITELRNLIRDYDEQGLPGCCGSMDVVHLKWLWCLTGNHNPAKGKADYPTIGFECITNFHCRIIGIFGPQFGTRNNKETVKVDTNVHLFCTGDIWWSYYSENSCVLEDRGV